MTTKRLLRLNPATPAGYAEMLIRARIDRARALSASGDAGASVVEWVVITALLITLALTIGAIILTAVKDKADKIKLDTPAQGV